MTRFPGLPAAALVAANLAVADLVGAAPLAAQTTETPANAASTALLPETVLSLSETAEVLRAPDELRASLRAEARGANAAAVQAQVNRAMEQALAAARGVSGVRASTGGYWTNRVEEGRSWTASQTLNLRAAEPAAMLELVGRLQGQGLVMGDLSWRLSREAETAARQEAGKLAIEALRQRAEAVAAQLGLRVAGIRQLRLDAPEVPMPRMMAMAATARRESAPPPVTAPEEVAVTSTAAAEILLRR